MNAALAQYSDGRWRERVNADSIYDWGRLEDGPELGGATTDIAADQHLDAGFAKTAQDTAQGDHTIIVEVGKVPLVDCDIADTVTVTLEDGTTGAGRVERVSYSMDVNGFPRAVVTV